MTSFAELYKFLKIRYRHDRFEGRNGVWDPDYSGLVTKSTMDYLEKYGQATISAYESTGGIAIKFNSALELMKI